MLLLRDVQKTDLPHLKRLAAVVEAATVAEALRTGLRASESDAPVPD